MSKCPFVVLIGIIVLLFYFDGRSEEIKGADVSVDSHIGKADSYYRDGRHVESISEAKRAIELRPDDPRGYNFLVVNYARQRKYREAVNASQRQLEVLEAKDIFDVNIVTRHAALLEVSGGYDQAIEFLESYREKFPKTVDSHVEGLKKAKEKRVLYYPYFR